jgi:hypothetical protein
MSAVHTPGLPVSAVPTEAELEFDRQVDALTLAGLPTHLDLSDRCFRAFLEPLRDLVPVPVTEGATGIPFVVVVPDLAVTDVLAGVHTVDGVGFTTMDDADIARFRPLPELDLPTAPYLLLDVDTGADTLGQRPAEVLPRLVASGRSPLTIAEGLAVLVSDPGVLKSRNAFSLLGSRAEDERVPALWTSDRRPRLGLCHQGAPHAWLGSASCAGRLGEQAP